MPFEKPKKIVLKFSKEQYWYVKTQPIHKDQVVDMKEDHALVILEVVPTYELIMLIMGWGPEVEVIQPKSLRKKIMKLHRESFDKCNV
jgi:predicted DNA-binding transcriptional regulator YafY